MVYETFEKLKRFRLFWFIMALFGSELNDVYKALYATLEAAGDTIDQDKIYKHAVTEYSKHSGWVAGKQLGAADKIDALVDAFYYLLDTVVRGRGTWTSQVVMEGPIHNCFEAVKAFTWGAFGENVSKPYDSGFPFVVSMVLSELLEYSNNDPSDVVGNRKYLERRLTPHYTTGKWPKVTSVAEGLSGLLSQFELAVDEQWPGIFIMAFDEVHEANLRKGVKLGDRIIYSVSAVGKITKPDGWYGPNMEAIYRRYQMIE